jgi:hypothetical protein
MDDGRWTLDHGPWTNYTSNSSASSARSMMKRKRALASLPISHNLIDDIDAQQASGLRIQGRLPKHLRHHLTQALEARDLWFAAPVPLLLQNAVALPIVQSPERFLADVDAIQRRLRQIHLSLFDQLRDVPIDERQQQRRDVIAVRICVGEDDQFAVAKPREIEVLTQSAPAPATPFRYSAPCRAGGESPGVSDPGPAWRSPQRNRPRQ